MMAFKFYVSVMGGKGRVHVAWEECKRFKAMNAGVISKGFDDVNSAIKWAKAKGADMSEKDFPEYIMHCEPVLSDPVVIVHDKKITSGTGIVVYTDGSCISNPGGPGGFASVALFPDDREIIISGREFSTTSNRMEIMAVLTALDYIVKNNFLKEITEVVVVTDSRYIHDMFEKNWVERWISNGWKTAEGENVRNKDILEILVWLARKTRARFVWVRAHNGNVFNEKVNDIAFREAGQAAQECGFVYDGPGVTVSASYNKPKRKPYRPKNNSHKKASWKDHVAQAHIRVSPDVKNSQEAVVETNTEKFAVNYRNAPVTRHNKNKKAGKADGQAMKKSSFRMEMRDGSIITLPLSAKQNELITLILGLVPEDSSGNIQMFDDSTLGCMASCKDNPLQILLLEHKKLLEKNSK